MKTLATLFLLAASLLLRAADAPADSCNHQLYYTSPAAIWEETLPLGNGRLGMMPDGGILREHIVLNEISLWSGMEADYSNPDASKSLPAIRQLLFEGKNREAQELMYSSFVPKKQETDGRYGTYQVLGDLDIDFTYNSSLSILNSPLNNYRRWLNLRDAVAYTAFRLEDVDYHREYFVSRDRDVMLIHLVAGREGALNFSARFLSSFRLITPSLLIVPLELELIFVFILSGRATPSWRLSSVKNPIPLSIASFGHVICTFFPSI